MVIPERLFLEAPRTDLAKEKVGFFFGRNPSFKTQQFV
jgi:hypothetical protein